MLTSLTSLAIVEVNVVHFEVRPMSCNLVHPFARLGALLLGAGAIGLVATCGAYVVAGPVAALPGGGADAAAAIAATAGAAGAMRAASLFGMPSDVLLALGAALLAAVELRRGSETAFAGWLALALASALFVAVDALVGFVLPAAAAHGEAAYAGLRSLFDTLFAAGALIAGAGALAAAGPRDALAWRWRAVGWLMRAAGAVGVLASLAFFADLPGARLIGPGIALLALAALGAAAAAYAASRSRIAPITAW
jgi:hypothetical protein